MTFKQRLRFYFIGFGMGLLVLAMVLNRRGCKGLNVNTQKIEELRYQKWEINDAMRCKLKCAGFATDSLFFKDVLTCKVNYGESSIHEEPCGKYVLESSAKSAGTYTLLIADCDSTSKLLDVFIKSPCACK
jgi:hypothetical protein